MPTIPNRIECYDISTTQGTAIVASRVVFVMGVPKKAEYRRFNIRSVDHKGPDDYQSMREALTRRLNRWKQAHDDPVPAMPGKEDRDETWRLLPDLFLIDGGKGQLGIAIEVLTEFGLFGKVPVVALAKQFEELYLPGQPAPVILPRRSDALSLVQRVLAQVRHTLRILADMRRHGAFPERGDKLLVLILRVGPQGDLPLRRTLIFPPHPFVQHLQRRLAFRPRA